MSKHARRPAESDLAPGGLPFARPGIEDCLFHRCQQHDAVPMLNANEEQTQSECGACLVEDMLAVRAQQLYVLDGYAERLTYTNTLRKKLASARERLNLLSPGAGDFLDQDDR